MCGHGSSHGRDGRECSGGKPMPRSPSCHSLFSVRQAAAGTGVSGCPSFVIALALEPCKGDAASAGRRPGNQPPPGLRGAVGARHSPSVAGSPDQKNPGACCRRTRRTSARTATTLATARYPDWWNARASPDEGWPRIECDLWSEVPASHGLDSLPTVLKGIEIASNLQRNLSLVFLQFVRLPGDSLVDFRDRRSAETRPVSSRYSQHHYEGDGCH